MYISDFEEIVNKFQTLEIDEQEYLNDIFQKQIVERKREQLILDIKIAEENIERGDYKKGTVDEFLAELEV